MCDSFDKAVLSDKGPLALQCSAASNFSELTKNILTSRYIPLTYSLQITLGTPMFPALGLLQELMSSKNEFHIHFSTPH